MLLTHGSSMRAACGSLTVGNFDGIHRGHQTMLQRLRTGRASAASRAACSASSLIRASFFSPQARPRADLVARKTRVARGTGWSACTFSVSDARSRPLAPEAFVEQVLAKRLRRAGS